MSLSTETINGSEARILIKIAFDEWRKTALSLDDRLQIQRRWEKVMLYIEELEQRRWEKVMLYIEERCGERE